jgi:hypothetical protein
MSETGGFQARSKGKAILFSIVTLGFYPLYWMHQFHVEAKEETGADYSPILRTIGLFIPFYNFYVLWQDSQIVDAEFDMSAAVSFVLALFVGPIWWFLVQGKINERAGASA